ncbi:MAG: YggS family pyridoxal phosphate-dependent enzyme [Anaerolineales bacterium]|nr:YggS family pyridoxal phosphate-dependent enzyme [Anaerolineales bacterium]
MDISQNLTYVKQEIKKTAGNAGRDPDEIKLVVVTKEKPANVVKEVLEAGVKSIGESYLQEAVFKMELLSDFGIEWHMIGHIQGSKANRVAALFDYIHSVDRLEIADQLNQAAQNLNRVLPVLLEFNLSGEPTKYGWRAKDEKDWERLAGDLETVMEMSNLEINGLMTMAPYYEDPEKARPIFRKLRKLRNFLRGRFEEHDLPELSMGMSGDYHVAIEEGATILRIGSAIVGSRT